MKVVQLSAEAGEPTPTPATSNSVNLSQRTNTILAASKNDKPNVARDAWEIMPGRFLVKMDVKMMISLNLITVEDALATIDGAFTPSVDILHGVPSSNNNIESSSIGRRQQYEEC